MTHAKKLSIHKQSAQIHMDARVIERIGIRFNRHDSRRIIDGIHAKLYGKGYVTEYSQSRAWFLVNDETIHAWVLYDNRLNRLVTCLPPDEIPYGIKLVNNSMQSNAI